ncbi:NAD-binding protein [Nocardioides sp. R-C-SC26]|uniref:CASTOR/POLLUX-related putative ion channel n=1 Tax=Nocardioides sp. R-C-SC26 TaxID=2870414 RepID=UPI001E2CF8E4|nr:NAD-binding protein [Nocardioides sp. R-C-SC26]
MRRRTTQALSARQSESSGGKDRSEIAWRARLRYAFDNSMAKGTPALIAWLTVATVVLITFFAVLTLVLGLRGDSDNGFADEVFQALLHALDPGTVAGDTGTPWRFIITMLALTIGGLFIVSALIGVIAAGIDAKIAELQRGRSIVLETEHTVILGWSESIFTILSELSIANESRKRPVIVVLADRDKVEMEEAIRAKVPDLRGTRVVCRSGSPMDVDDLALSSHASARSVILLAPDASDDPDSEVIKTLLALTHDGDAGPGIVAEIRNPSNLEVARLIGRNRVVLLDIRETVAKLLVQTSRQSGAAAVYTELFDYDGDEIYFLDEHGLGARTYGEAVAAFESASVIGLVRDGAPTLNPPPETVLGDASLVVVAADDDELASLTPARVAGDLDALGVVADTAPQPTQALVIGWDARGPIVLRELDKYAPPGSTLTVVTTFGEVVLPQLRNLDVRVVVGPTTDRATLSALLTEDLDQVMVLCYSEHLEHQAADARTLVTLLHVRDILAAAGVSVPVVSEMLDDRNRVLAEVAHVDDVVVSGEIVSLLVTQMSEDRRLEAVFDQLLGDEGSEIYLRPVEWYVQPGERSYATVVAGALRRNETALGYKQGHDVVVNPAKSDRIVFGPDDRIVVLAED